MDTPAVSTQMFTKMLSFFDETVMDTITTGSTNIISLISPLMSMCFTIYVLLICWGYWRGLTEEPVQDFLFRMVGWVVILTFGMNIQYYSDTVVPFFTGAGDDVAAAITGNTNTASSLDSILSMFINTCGVIYKTARGFQTITAMWTITIICIFGTPFLFIAAAYIILAKFGVGLLLALGPLFICLALFPFTREYFSRWIGQCMNYVFLVCLFAGAAALECKFAIKFAPTPGATLDVKQVIEFEVMGMVFFIISLNLPSMASQLAGGVGISSMVGKLRPSLSAPGSRAAKALVSGGSVSNKS